MSILRDANRQMYTTMDAFSIAVCKPGTFSGTINARGDFDGTGMPFTLFNVTGDVLVRIYGVGVVTLVSAGGGSLSVGVTANTGLLIASTTATSIAANVVWLSASPAIGFALSSLGTFIVPSGLNIIETIGTADITAGSLNYICLWRPLSPGSSLVSAV